MRYLQGLVVVSVIAVMAAGCGTGTDIVEPAGTGQPTAAPADRSADAEAAATADTWLEEAVMPPGAVRSETVPDASPSFEGSYYAWPCSPMEERTGYWIVEGADVVEASNWLKEHPTADLMVPVATPLAEDMSADIVSLGNVPERDSLEGISFTVTGTEGGAAIRAEIGVFTETTVCPTLEPGVSWGGPGQG